MKLKDLFVKFSSGDEIKFLSLEAIIIFGSHPLDENGEKMCRFDDLYTWSDTPQGWRYVKLSSINNSTAAFLLKH